MGCPTGVGGGLVGVLSIGKLATGQANYYLRMADGRVDRATSVASGVEDYYAGEDAAGEWLGGGSLRLGVKGKVEAGALHAVLAGIDPAIGGLLRDTKGTRVPGFDLTFSAPKSVSVLFGVGDRAVVDAIRRAHDAAVRDAMGYVERAVSVARRGHGGQHVIAGRGLVAAAFRHQTSRLGDPQLHTHVLVANLIEGADGRWSALDGRLLYAHAKTASYLYEARLRAELTARLGVEWTPVRKGLADIRGVSPTVIRAFSRRRAEIVAELERRGESSAAAAQIATLATRRAKDTSIDAAELSREWRARAAGLGLDRKAIEALLGRVTGRKPEPELLLALAEQLASRDGLTRDVSSFSRRDVIRAWCDALPPGCLVDAAFVERLADRFLATHRAVPLLPPGAQHAETRSGGSDVARHEQRYSTPELLAIEARIVEVAIGGTGEPVGRARREDVEAAIARRPYLAPEQKTMIRRLALEGGTVAVVVGKAGTGKTTALAAAREAWAASGTPVIGAAVARRAARELQDAAGIPSESLEALLRDLRRGGPYALAAGAVVVLDEASMVATRDLGELVGHVVEARGKLVLCGDARQLPSIRAGGIFAAVAARTAPIELADNRRQVQAWERDALDALRSGSVADAVRLYEANDRLVLGGDRALLLDRLVADWWASSAQGGEAVMIAVRRADVRELNARARQRMRSAGRLGADVDLEIGRFAAGDRVVLRRNDRRLGVSNGDVGHVLDCTVDLGMTVRVRGGDVLLPPSYLAGTPTRRSVEHAYAITGHVAQGMTVDHAHVLGSAELYREWGYTAMSRGRQSNKLYVVAPDSLDREDFAPGDRLLPDVAEALDQRLSITREQTAAVDVATIEWLKRSPTQTLQARLEQLDHAQPRESLAHHVKEREQLARRAEQLERQIAAAEQKLARLSESRPSRFRREARKTHDAGVDLHDRSRSGLARIRRSVLREIEQRDSSIQLLRAQPVDIERDAEARRIRSELARRSAIERQLERPAERSLTSP